MLGEGGMTDLNSASVADQGEALNICGGGSSNLKL